MTANMEKLRHIGGVLTCGGKEKKQKIYLNVKVYGFFSIEVSSGIRIANILLKIRTGTTTSNGLGFPPSGPIRGVPNR